MAEQAEDKLDLPKQAKEVVKSLTLDMKQITRTESILNANQVQKIFNTTPKKYKYKRPGKGGGEWNYVRASYVRRVLDSLFGFNWDFEVETTTAEAFEVAKVTKCVVVKGILTGRVKVDGKWIDIKKTQFGRAEVKFKKLNGAPTSETLDFGNDLKAATSDALKKCASLLGIAADVYEAEEFQEIQIVGAEGNTERDENVKEMVEKAKEVIATQGKKVGKPNE